MTLFARGSRGGQKRRTRQGWELGRGQGLKREGAVRRPGRGWDLLPEAGPVPVAAQGPWIRRSAGHVSMRLDRKAAGRVGSERLQRAG